MSEISGALKKEHKLRGWMRKREAVLVAYSGGVDSAYLALIATRELADRAVCVTGVSPSVSEYQLEAASRIARAHGFRHRLHKTFEMTDPNYRKNSGNRCYFCKKELYQALSELSVKEYGGADVIDGANADDEMDIRPGKQAAFENGVLSPLFTFGFTKDEIRELSQGHGLETWDKPASPCLASRIAIGIPVTTARLGLVEKGEEILRRSGFVEFRLRVHEEVARIEIAPAEMEIPGFFEKVRESARDIKGLGFKFVALELAGFRSGSLSEISVAAQAPRIQIQ